MPGSVVTSSTVVAEMLDFWAARASLTPPPPECDVAMATIFDRAIQAPCSGGGAARPDVDQAWMHPLQRLPDRLQTGLVAALHGALERGLRCVYIHVYTCVCVCAAAAAAVAACVRAACVRVCMV